MPSSFRLVMRSGPTAGKVFPLEKGEILIGRDLNNEVVINDPEISRRHARLYLQGNTYVLEDLGSTNGTFVGGQRLTGPYPLRIGEVITLGERVTLVFELNLPDADATVASASVQAAQPGPAQPPVQPPPGYPQAQPAPTPVYPPAAGAGYQGQAPLPSQGPYAGQVPYAAEPEQPRSQNRTVMILLIVLAVILVITCLCIGIFLWNAPLEFWCQFPIWPAGACP
uniref:FHA domain-containing protein n=1 Tax=Anaerolinea thermolimosa TaxID=229919 RepID=A0A7C4PIG1_9CHLR